MIKKAKEFAFSFFLECKIKCNCTDNIFTIKKHN